MRGDLRAPDARAADDDVGRDLALVGDDAGDLAVLDAGRRGPRGGPGSCTPRPLARPICASTAQSALARPSVGHQQAAEDLSRSTQRVQLARTRRRRRRWASMPQEVSQPWRRCSSAEALGGGRDLEAADLQEAGLALVLEGDELLHRVAGHLGHGLGAVGLEDQARGVRGRSAGRGQVALVDDGDVGPAARGQLVGEGRADDSGADDDGSPSSHGSSSCCVICTRLR